MSLGLADIDGASQTPSRPGFSRMARNSVSTSANYGPRSKKIDLGPRQEMPEPKPKSPDHFLSRTISCIPARNAGCVADRVAHFRNEACCTTTNRRKVRRT
jgi:hypothetical protein